MSTLRLSGPSVSLFLLLGSAPLLNSCGGCQENKLAGKGDVDDDDPGEEYVPDWGQWLSMTQMQDGKPALSYFDRDDGGLGFAIGTVSGDAVSWAHERVDGYADASGLDAGNRGTYSSVTTAADGTVWAAFHDIGAKNLRWAKRDPLLGAWINGIADVGEGLDQMAGLFASITLDADGNPVVVHHDQGMGTLRIARHNGVNFVGSVLDEGEPFIPIDTGTGEEEQDANTGMFSRIRLHDGDEYVAYYDEANGDLRLAIGGPDGFEFHTIDSEGDVGQWPDFQWHDGEMHIAYHDAGRQMLKYAIGVPGGEWLIRTVDDSPYVGADTALYFEGDKPRVVYFDGQSNDMKLATFDGGDWTHRTIASEGAKGFHNEVGLVDGRPFVASYDYTSRTVYFAPLD